MRVSSVFDSGNIVVKSAKTPGDIRLEIRKDNGSDFYQWFHFRLTGARGQDCVMTIENAAGAAYPDGWRDYRAVASTDRETWVRVPTDYVDGKLVIRHTPDADAVWYAYFAPYSMERHADLLARCQASPRARLDVIGETLDGRTLDRLVIGEPGEGKAVIWVTARQHPGETMAEWAAEGLLERLLDPADGVARALLDRAVFHVVPNMNPDGSARGHLRTNAKGVNLNREWNKASPENSPEVHAVLERMAETGVDLFLDMHGDEALPHNFIAGGEGAPSFTDEQGALLEAYKDALAAITPDFQTAKGYPVDAPGAADLSIATNYMAETFGGLAMTLEMSFKDCVEAPDPVHGWSPAHARKLGAANLDAMRAVMDRLR
ncbi:hypothetical protein DDZ18_08900 [Marinicauda salina]|uniref:Peptidase M14 domain-containing protein n=1 Tax=Marinicauda salina TaxID=2135793 RepID=A0A2U2BUT0_9PROT|nr:M14-type cytosolic carboxypeptidase [Marinicauda salina]PWE17762.1 hypothetical protein DDZ18_08900 [Marinicauda salina]